MTLGCRVCACCVAEKACVLVEMALGWYHRHGVKIFLVFTWPSHHRASLNFSGPVLMQGDLSLGRVVSGSPLLRAVASWSPASHVSFPPLAPVIVEFLPATWVRKHTLNPCSEVSGQRDSVNCGAPECRHRTGQPEREMPAEGHICQWMSQVGS